MFAANARALVAGPEGPQGPQGSPGTVTDPLPLHELQVRQVQGYPSDNLSSLLINGDSVAGQGTVTVNASHPNGITITATNGPITIDAATSIALNTGSGGSLSSNGVVFDLQRKSGTITFTGACWQTPSVDVGWDYLAFGNMNVLWIRPIFGNPGGASGYITGPWPSEVPLPPPDYEDLFSTSCIVDDVVDNSVYPPVIRTFPGNCTIAISGTSSTISFSSTCNGTKSDHYFSTFNQPGANTIGWSIGVYATQIVWFST